MRVWVFHIMTLWVNRLHMSVQECVIPSKCLPENSIGNRSWRWCSLSTIFDRWQIWILHIQMNTVNDRAESPSICILSRSPDLSLVSCVAAIPSSLPAALPKPFQAPAVLSAHVDQKEFFGSHKTGQDQSICIKPPRFYQSLWAWSPEQLQKMHQNH